MWHASVSLVFAASLFAQADFSAILRESQAQLNSPNLAPQQALQQLNRLSNGFRSQNWQSTQARSQAALGTLGLLNSLRGRAGFGNQRELGLGMADLYRQVGPWLNPQDAWLGYRSSFLLLNQLQNQFPQDPAIRQSIHASRAAIEVIEARIPDLPRLDWSSLPPAAQAEFDRAMERYISVSSTVSSAEVTAETMRRTLASQGLAARPDSIAALTRMKLKLEEARRLIEEQRFSPALERLNAAEAEARNVLKAYGG
jgi:hypothetical protein